jgi:hypothetical protein
MRQGGIATAQQWQRCNRGASMQLPLGLPEGSRYGGKRA